MNEACYFNNVFLCDKILPFIMNCTTVRPLFNCQGYSDKSIKTLTEEKTKKQEIVITL